MTSPVDAAVAAALALAAGACAATPSPPPDAQAALRSEASVRAGLEAAYARNREALLARDLAGVLALRTADFSVTTPDGAVHGAEEMAAFSRSLLDNVAEWEALSFDIRSIALNGDEAAAEVRQHSIRRMRRPAGTVERVENWVTQRETWLATPAGWKIRRVDNIRDQRVLVDGVPRA